jgi:predicted aconitase
MSLALTRVEQDMLDGRQGPARALAMRIVTTLAGALGAGRLLAVESVHVDGCLYHGQAGLDFVERLVELDGEVVVPTTLNVGSLDLLHPEVVRLPEHDRANARRLMDAYVALGATPTWTCAPYFAGHRPARGQHIAWAESNAIVFANSVLGARTDRYGDFVDICAGLTGRAPAAGLHLTANRRATLEIDCAGLPPSMLRLDAAWAALGHLIGALASDRVPVVTGIDGPIQEEHLRALGAAASSRGGVGLFHVVGTTPEAATIDDATGGIAVDERYEVTADDVRRARDELSTAPTIALDAVSVGTPHLSVTELAELARLVQAAGTVAPGIEFWASTSRANAAAADAAGWSEVLHAAGVKLLTDTCTYLTPVLRAGTRHVMTNSAKWAWYAPVNLGVEVSFGSLADCVASAQAGKVVRDDRSWA